MRRFFFDPLSRKEDTLFLAEEESRHVAKVLRLPVGSEMELFDGQGTVYRAIVVATGRRVEVRIVGVVARDEGAGKTLWVGQGILKGEKMDTVVQKCTELGASRFSPFESSRCQGKADPAQNRKRHERWQRIGLAACKQCMRPKLMQIDAPTNLSDLLRGTDVTVRLLFWEEEKDVRLQDIPDLQKAQSVALLLGPEGGFSPEEVDLARQVGWLTVSLGGRILRAETATLTAVSIVQFLIGNL
ncbi:MAG: 16S rRNA (uracil(1498)-N(3))-methyltransferase [Proteobacteria bacterium]|nr:16S rRNA (uracil(1498)-N(3))-methyltransferase [Pseudomonadota bacterium]